MAAVPRGVKCILLDLGWRNSMAHPIYCSDWAQKDKAEGWRKQSCLGVGRQLLTWRVTIPLCCLVYSGRSFPLGNLLALWAFTVTLCFREHTLPTEVPMGSVGEAGRPIGCYILSSSPFSTLAGGVCKKRRLCLLLIWDLALSLPAFASRFCAVHELSLPMLILGMLWSQETAWPECCSLHFWLGSYYLVVSEPRPQCRKREKCPLWVCVIFYGNALLFNWNCYCKWTFRTTNFI